MLSKKNQLIDPSTYPSEPFTFGHFDSLLFRNSGKEEVKITIIFLILLKGKGFWVIRQTRSSRGSSDIHLKSGCDLNTNGFYEWMRLRAVRAGGTGGHWSPPVFGRSGNTNSNEGGRLYPPHYYLPPRFSDLPTALRLFYFLMTWYNREINF